MNLDQFINELIRKGEPLGYQPVQLIQMRDEYGTIAAIECLVEKDRDHSGFQQLCELNMAEWCLEAAVVRFPEDFSRRTIEIATARLN